MKISTINSRCDIIFCITLCVTALFTSQMTFAQSTTLASTSSDSSTTSASPAKKTTAKKPMEQIEVATAVEAAIDEDDTIPDIQKSVTYEYKCELNDFLTIYTNVDDNNHLALRWKRRLYRLKRIETTTGANRFENKKAGLVWIGIPTKAMLLDSRHGQQLANECKTSNQL